MRIAFIVVAALVMFAALFAYDAYVHTPFIAGLCASNCAKQGMGKTLKRDGYGRSSSTSCKCLNSARPGAEPEFKRGYFLVSSKWLDWFLMIWVRYIPLGVIVGVFLFAMAKVVARFPRP